MLKEKCKSNYQEKNLTQLQQLNSKKLYEGFEQIRKQFSALLESLSNWEQSWKTHNELFSNQEIKVGKHKVVVKNSCVEVDNVWVIGTHAGKTRQIFDILCEQFLKDTAAGKAPHEFETFTGSAIASKMNWDYLSVRQAIARLRSRIQKQVKAEQGIEVAPNDIIQNIRDWQGYRINPETVIICSG
ncbi:MAG: hypothetical protein KAV18_04895 [Candidatus Omnitrophica bacterium]|nr:hypothetical protein [Candidatus Omnitrophota bacterium]